MRLYRFSLLIFVASLLAACALLTDDLKMPEVSLVNIKPAKIGLFEQRFQIRLRVKNPNPVALPIQGLQYKLQLNDLDFAQGGSNRAITVPANGESTYDVEATTELTKLLRHLNLVSRGPVTYRLNGDATLASHAVKIPFDYAGQIKLKF